VIARLALLAALAAPGVSRLPAAGGGEVTVSAEKVRYSFPRHRIDYTGNPVRLTRGDATLTCKKLGAQMDDADRVVGATCEGDVHFERAGKLVTCEKATYDDPAQKLTCEGNPVLHSGGLTAEGKLLVYDLAQDEVTMDAVRGNLPSADADAQLQKLQSQRKGKAGGGK
jgi:lipopolysaccharide export system protein LptA